MIVNLYPDRVTRDSSGTITLVDISSMNLYARSISGWDFNASYRWTSRELGVFSLEATQSLILHTTTQFSLTTPSYEGVDYPSDTSIGGALKQKTNIILNWERGRWNAGWTTHLISAYKEYGAAGGPLSMQFANGLDYLNYVKARGSDTIPSQATHDVVVGYRFGSGNAGSSPLARITEGLSLTVGIRNVFDTAPEFDTGPFGLGFVSSFVDIRMREYWISLRRTF